MINLILTPVYNTPERILEACAAIDKHAVNPFVHIVIDDNSDEIMPVEITKNRRMLIIRSDIPARTHKNQLGQAIQIGYDYAHHAFMNEIPNPKYDHVFLIESDVVVRKAWDQKMIDKIPSLPKDWATLDVQSYDEEENLTYPTVRSPRWKEMDDGLEHMHYADFQCTLFNPAVFKIGVKWSDLASHFDILWSKKITEVSRKQHYRTKDIGVFHHPGSSREILIKKARAKEAQGIKV